MTKSGFRPFYWKSFMGEIEMKDDWTKLWYFAKFVSATDRRRFEIKFRQNFKKC